MKTVRRNAVILTVALFVCAAVYLNWSYNKKTEDAALENDPEGDISAMEPEEPDVTADAPAGDGGVEDDAGLYYSVNGGGEDADTETPASQPGPYDEYFAKVRLERTEARDEAAATLAAVASADGASQETIDNALRSMTALAERAVKEAELENLIRAKGFIDCVVYISDSGVKVTVASEEGLTKAGAAKITDVIVSETDYTAGDLKVIEIK